MAVQATCAERGAGVVNELEIGQGAWLGKQGRMFERWRRRLAAPDDVGDEHTGQCAREHHDRDVGALHGVKYPTVARGSCASRLDCGR